MIFIGVNLVYPAGSRPEGVYICGLKSPNLLGGEVPLTHKS